MKIKLIFSSHRYVDVVIFVASVNQALEKINLNLLLCITFQPHIPPPDYKLPPEKLGYLRHVTPAPKQAMPDNFHVESIHLRHAYRPSSSQSEKPRYAHLLRKTGRRGELGIEDDDDSDVTRICFNVPLVGVT